MASSAGEGKTVKLVRIEPTWMWSHLGNPSPRQKAQSTSIHLFQYSCFMALNAQFITNRFWC
jgi:hypothetical protein